MKIVITNHGTDRNRGDLAILAATVALVRQHAPGAEVVVVSVEEDPREPAFPDAFTFTERSGCRVIPSPVLPLTRTRHGIARWCTGLARAELGVRLTRIVGVRAQRVLPPSSRDIFREFRDADLIIGKGGSYLHCRGGWREALYAWRMVYPYRVAQALDRPLIPLGISIGPFNSKVGQRIVRRPLRKLPTLVVRESISQAIAVDELGVDAGRTVKGRDMVFALQPPRPLPARPRHVVVGFTVRRHPALGADYETAVVEAARALLARDASTRVVFIAQVGVDAELSRSLLERIDHPRARLVRPAGDHDSMLAAYASLSVLVATRLHSAILAAIVGTPFIHLPYDEVKGPGIAADLGMGSWVIPPARCTSGGLVDAILALLDTSEAVRSALLERTEALGRDVDRITHAVISEFAA